MFNTLGGEKQTGIAADCQRAAEQARPHELLQVCGWH